MKLLYVHTAEKVKKIGNNTYYTDGTYNENVWKRYIDFSDNSVTFYTTLDDSFYTKEEVSLKYNRIPQNIKVVTTYNLTSSIKIFFDIKKRRHRHKQIEELVKEADAIIIRVPCNTDSIVVKYAKKYKKKYMLEVVGCGWDSLWGYNWKGKILAPFRYIRQKRIIKNGKYCMYVSNIFLQKRYPNLHNNIGCSDVVINVEDDEVLNKRIRKICSEKNKIIIGTIGSLETKYKGQEYVIKAIKHLESEGIKNIEYQLVGQGQKDRLEKIAVINNVQDKIKFMGTLKHNDIFSWFDNIDIYIQPSNTEGLPRSVIEAMSRACPCIGSKVGGIPELINDSFVFRKKDTKKIAYLIKKMICSNDEMIEQAKLNFNNSKKYNSKDLIIKRNDFYEKFRKEI